jgi:anaerobic ribonucleoside-triphosphate reductase
MKLSRSQNSTKKSKTNLQIFIYFDNQYPAIKPQEFIKSEIQGKLQTPPTNFSLRIRKFP